MSASLSFSITSLAPVDGDGAAQERLLRTIAARFPGLVFFDVLRRDDARVPVRVAFAGATVQVTPVPVGQHPAHVGAHVADVERELLWLFEDVGDVLLPLSDPALADDVDLTGDAPRVVAAHAALRQAIEDHLADADFVGESDARTLEFLEQLRATVAIAADEALPLVVHW